MDGIPMIGLTQRQKSILAYLKVHTQRNGYPPSMREVGDFLGGVSTNAVNGHYKALESKGYIKRIPNTARAIQLTQPK